MKLRIEDRDDPIPNLACWSFDSDIDLTVQRHSMSHTIRHITLQGTL